MDKRDDPELYVHPHYYRVTYLAAYENPIQPMPGPKNWEKVKLRQPLPPMLKVQPGRPKANKRKLEPGEGTSAAPEGKKPKVMKQCKNCGGFGHFAKTCKAEAAPEQPNPPATNPKGGRPQMQTPWIKEQRKKSEEKAARHVFCVFCDLSVFSGFVSESCHTVIAGCTEVATISASNNSTGWVK